VTSQTKRYAKSYNRYNCLCSLPKQPSRRLTGLLSCPVMGRDIPEFEQPLIKQDTIKKPMIAKMKCPKKRRKMID